MSVIDIKFNIKEAFSSIPGEKKDWKLVGEESNGCLLISWRQKNYHDGITKIAIFNEATRSIEVLCELHITGIIQASINANKTILGFVTSLETYQDAINHGRNKYDLHIVSLAVKDAPINISQNVVASSNFQIMIQFLEKSKIDGLDKFLVFIHQNSINQYHVNDESFSENIEKDWVITDVIVKAFAWAQWDPKHQCLFYIHYRKSHVSIEEEEVEEENPLPIFSALQFHTEAPHETVLNIPLNLPLPLSESVCNTYEDWPLPLRIHDCTLNVKVLTDDRGVVCICHHYLYQPVQAPQSPDSVDESTTVHLAYSVTLLHHGKVVHCTIPGIPWLQATQLKPLFSFYEEEHIIVYSPGVFLHLLDIGPGHEPSCHIILSPDSSSANSWCDLSSCLGFVINVSSLDLASLSIKKDILLKAYADLNAGITNKLSILHYFLVHHTDFETVTELLMAAAENCFDASLHKIFHEVLIGGAFSSVLRSLPSDGIPLLRFLPLTTVNYSVPVEVKYNGSITTMTQEVLWNSAVILLSPRQRLCPLAVDLWTKLWDLIATSNEIARFKPSTIVEKLMVSLVCYQPEALSRCSTPLSPGTGFAGGSVLADMMSFANGRTKPQLPFYEIEKCTASKQEHIISVNLRELSMHLVKHGRENPMQVHAVATRHAAAQLEMSRFLCYITTKSAGISTQNVKGFLLVNELSQAKKLILFSMLEKYNLAIETLAYPLPQGFSSFFTYLGYQTLQFDTFIQYVQANVLQLQIDVTKMILTDLDSWSDGVKQKLRLLLLLPRSRAKRLLNQWSHSASMMIRAREHAANILSGLETRSHPHRTKSHSSAGLSTFCSAARVSPLDTFLDLLTAKASLAELDFNLLVEATTTSTKSIFD